MPKSYVMKGLGRLRKDDGRDHDFLMSSVLKKAPIPKSGRKMWYNDVSLNQGNTPTCVGHAWAGFLISQPKRQFGVDPFDIYREAQKVDEWPGNSYNGTSVRAGAKVLRKIGKLKSYRWAFDIKTTLNWLYNVGPVVVGTLWYTGMYRPNRAGLIRPTGRPDGGHAYILQGVDFNRKQVRICNSWGINWGQRGRAWMYLGHLNKLIRQGGEICAAVE